jgi:hypothetical protein
VSLPPKFVISLTTIPSRVADLPRVLETLLAQDYVPFEIHVNVPTGVTIPHKLAGVRYFDVPDEGPVTKLLGTVRRVTDPDTYLVIVDDDHLYHEKMLWEYARWVRTMPDAAVGFQGLCESRESSTGLMFVTAVGPQDAYPVEYLQGFKSACFRRAWFPVGFTDGWAHTHWGDDFTIGSWLGAQGIRRYVVGWEHETDHRARVLSFPVVGEVSHGADGCAIFRQQDGGEWTSDRRWFTSPMAEYARLDRARGAPPPAR